MAKLLFLPSLDQYFIIEAVTALELHLLFEWLTKISQILNQHGSQSKAYRSALGQIEKLCHLEFELKDLPIEDLTLAIKTIGEINFPPSEKTNKELSETVSVAKEEATWDRFCLELISSLVSLGLANNLEQAIAIAKELPYDRLKTLVTIKYDLINDTAGKKQKAELAKQHTDDLVNGRFFGGSEEGGTSFFSAMSATMNAKPPTPQQIAKLKGDQST